jgi:hypothetical protein
MKSVQTDGLISRKFSTLRWGSLLFGIDLGWIVGYGIYWTLLDVFNDFENFWKYESSLQSIFVATTALCAGIALIIVYLIERKAVKAKKEE